MSGKNKRKQPGGKAPQARHPKRASGTVTASRNSTICTPKIAIRRSPSPRRSSITRDIERSALRDEGLSYGSAARTTLEPAFNTVSERAKSDEELSVKLTGKSESSVRADGLDETTISAFLMYLQSAKAEERLNEDELVTFMKRMNATAYQKLRFQENLSDDNKEAVLQMLLDAEVSFAINSAFQRVVTSNVRKTFPNMKLEPKTVRSLKRSFETLNNATERQHLENSNIMISTNKEGADTISGDSKQGMRTTRGMARSNRTERRERGLQILMGALSDVEKSHGPFQSKKQRSRKAPAHQGDEILHNAEEVSQNTSVDMSSKKGSDGSKEKSLGRNDSESLENISISFRRAYPEQGSREGRLDSDDIPLPADRSIVELPRWNEDGVEDTSVVAQTDLAYPSRTRHSAPTYAALCKRLLQYIPSNARMFARHEFFYSDLDRGWYSRPWFEDDAEKLGIPPGSLLSRREWKAVRKAIRRKPRRFSKSFIASELNKRNLYRNAVRALQRDHSLIGVVDFPYDVPAPILPGTMVTAFSDRLQFLLRGVVLSFDPANALYVVRYENDLFSCEVCPDSQVASHGGPRVLWPGRSMRRLSSNPTNGRSSLYDETRGAVGRPPASFLRMAPHPAVVTESTRVKQETLNTLTSIIDRALLKKRNLLSAMKDAHAFAVTQLPFCNPSQWEVPTLDIDFERHYAGLRANLQMTDYVLEKAHQTIQVLYEYEIQFDASEGDSESISANLSPQASREAANITLKRKLEEMAEIMVTATALEGQLMEGNSQQTSFAASSVPSAILSHISPEVDFSYYANVFADRERAMSDLRLATQALTNAYL